MKASCARGYALIDMFISEEHLQKFLLDGGLVSKQVFDSAQREAKKTNQTVGEMLVSEGAIGEDELRRSYAYILGIPFVDLKKAKIDFQTLVLIPEPVARRNNIIAYNKKGDELEVAMLNTDDLAAIDFVKKKTRLKIQPRLTDDASIKKALRPYQRSLNDNLGEVIRRETKALETVTGDEGDMRKLAEGNATVRVVDTLLHHAIAQNASDIHVEPQEDSIILRYRIDGILHDAMVLPKSAGSALVARVKVLSNLRLDEKRLPQDGRFALEASGERVSFRVSILPVYYGEKVAIRILRESVSGFTLEALGFHGDSLDHVHNAARKTTGMILSTGPTGAGKSTTLYTLLDIVNTPNVNISTIEDPIEYQMPRINQTQVKPDIGFTFATGLRSLIRQDPDIIMVGEIRDKETANLAINAALTGHLVLSTLHTNSAAGAIPRLIDMGVEPFLLVSTLRVVIGQRLVRKLCSKEKHNLTRDEMARLDNIIDAGVVLKSLKEEGIVPKSTLWKDVPFYKPKETEECPDGYSGRVGIYEVLNMTESIKELVMHSATTDDLHARARKEGMLTMAEDGVFKASQGVTTPEEVFRVVSE
jgi:type IV pilus assembly protein PilB